MVKRKKNAPQWQLVVRGDQHEPLEADLLAQIVLMLGRQFAQETMTEDAESGSLPTVPPDEGNVS
jgi:hypothetical protein